jgi:hypothetical protein
MKKSEIVEVDGVENIEVTHIDSDVDIIKDSDLIVDQALLDNGEELYNRQQSLGIKAPDVVSIIGVGGVGCWVALDFALIGVKKIILMDNDTVDVSNLNRTMFKTSQVGQRKVIAMKELIMERRPLCNVVIYTHKYEDLAEPAKNEIMRSTVIDCRDSIKPLDKINSPIIGGYNGLNATIHVLPNLKHIFGEEQSPYTIIPSYVVVPEMIAAMIVNHICVENKTGQVEKVTNIDFKNFLKIFDKKPARKRSPVKKEASS